METVEIGAILLETSAGPISREFVSFVKPVAFPQLSAFCTRLTSIRQEDVDRAEPFWAVLPQFVAWIGEEPFRWCSWGSYDLLQLRTDCARHKMPFPSALENHINLKREFSRQKSVQPMGMRGALELLELPLIGTHHRGIDDARNLANIAMLLLPQMESEQKETSIP